MYRIIDKRGTGKTKNLLLLAKENNGIVVCYDPQCMTQKAYHYGIAGIKFMSYNDYLIGKQTAEQPIFIHDLEFLVNYMNKSKNTSNIAGYTISED